MSQLSIRPLKNTPEDAAVLLTWLTTPEVIALAYGEDAPWDPEKIHRHFLSKIGTMEVPCIIEWAGSPVGYIQYYPLEPDSYRFTDAVPFENFLGGYGIDLFLGVPALWGRGIGTEAIRQLSEDLLTQKNARLVCADPEETNIRSRRAFEKAGFSPAGRVKNYDEETKYSILMTKKQG